MTQSVILIKEEFLKWINELIINDIVLSVSEEKMKEEITKELNNLIELACKEKDEEIEKLKNEIKEKEIPSWSKREDSKYQTPIY